MKQGVLPGSFFLVSGIIFFIINLNVLDSYWVMVFIGMAMFFLYLYLGGATKRGNLGLLLSSFLLTIIPLYELLKDFGIVKQESFLLMILLASSFLVILFIHTIHDYQQNDLGLRFWPLLPGLMLIFIPVSSLFSVALWPIILLAAGGIMIAKSR